MWPNPQFPADLVTVTEEILNKKLCFLCSEKSVVRCYYEKAQFCAGHVTLIFNIMFMLPTTNSSFQRHCGEEDIFVKVFIFWKNSKINICNVHSNLVTEEAWWSREVYIKPRWHCFVIFRWSWVSFWKPTAKKVW